MELRPSPGYRYSFKRGMVGTDVAALQLNLPSSTVDGFFGPMTERGVRVFQEAAGLAVDGIAAS